MKKQVGDFGLDYKAVSTHFILCPLILNTADFEQLSNPSLIERILVKCLYALDDIPGYSFQIPYSKLTPPSPSRSDPSQDGVEDLLRKQHYEIRNFAKYFTTTAIKNPWTYRPKDFPARTLVIVIADDGTNQNTPILALVLAKCRTMITSHNDIKTKQEIARQHAIAEKKAQEQINVALLQANIDAQADYLQDKELEYYDLKASMDSDSIKLVKNQSAKDSKINKNNPPNYPSQGDDGILKHSIGGSSSQAQNVATMPKQANQGFMAKFRAKFSVNPFKKAKTPSVTSIAGVTTDSNGTNKPIGPVEASDDNATGDKKHLIADADMVQTKSEFEYSQQESAKIKAHTQGLEYIDAPPLKTTAVKGTVKLLWSMPYMGIFAYIVEES